MKWFATFLALATTLFLSGDALAQHGGGGGQHGGGGQQGGMGQHGGMGQQGGMGQHGPGGMGQMGPTNERGPGEMGSRGMNRGPKTPGEILQQNEKLSSRLATLLPTGTNLQQASSGFKNLGQFVAAVHVSHNLNIPFSELQGKMTGPHRTSLGRAIQELSPKVNSKAEARRATKQAKADLRETRR